MKIAFVGKGGSGKTTLASLFARHLSHLERPILAIDADINQNLAEALGATPEQAATWPVLGDHLDELKDYLRGTNPRIGSVAEMVKTTPPGRGSRLLRLRDDNPVFDRCVNTVGGVRLAVTGAFAEADLGVSCYHSKVGAVELILNHLVDGLDEYVVVDMTAGADAFASGLFTRFDRTVVVCEPTLRSVGVYRQYLGYAEEFDVQVSAVGNKVTGPGDEAFLREHLGDALVGSFTLSGHVKAAEQSRIQPIESLEPGNRAILDSIKAIVDDTRRDWPRYTRHAIMFHLRNAAAWANARTGVDLAKQIDPDFVLGTNTLTPDLPRSTMFATSG